MGNEFLKLSSRKVLSSAVFASLLIAGSPQVAFAGVDGVQAVMQAGVVKGQVVDASGEPIIGANVMVKGTTNGTITDMGGNFALNNAKGVLTVSFIGYKTQEIAVDGNETNLRIVLKEDTELLDEVVVVGYGTQKKVNLTGSVSTVNFEEQAKSRPVTNVSNALAGLSAGVQVQQSSGQPGSDGSTIRIRGIGTLNSNSPLVLVDGVEASMDAVNAIDVETISILKDASSASIYGSRAANGVILITTKRGEAGKLSVSYSGRFSYAQPTNLIDQVTDYADYMEWMNESLTNIGQASNFAQTTIDTWREKKKDPNGVNSLGVPNYVAYPNTDWQKALFGHDIINEHTISVRGGTDRLNVLLSAGYLDNPGLVDNTGIKKYSMRANVEAKIVNWLTVGTKAFGSVQDADPGNFSSANTYLRQTTPGVYPEWNGQYGYPEAAEESATANNILAFLNNTKGYTQTSRFNITLYSSIKPIKGLTWDFSLNYRRYWVDQETSTNPVEKVKFSTGEVMSTATTPENMTTYSYNRRDYNYTIQNILRYETTIAKDHDLSVIAGYEEYYNKYDYNSFTMKGLIDADITTPSSATEWVSSAGTTTDEARRSFFGRVNYAYKSRYLLEGNLRYDGSSRFDADHRWGTFPSFSAGWRISEEAFMESSRNWLDNLKFRISYGSVGNDGGTSVGEYEYQASYSTSRYSFGNTLTAGLAQTTLANSELSWETTTMLNAGIDLTALQNRLSVTVEGFRGKTTGILYRPSIYLTAGNKTAPRRNIAKMLKRGFEISLGWHDRVGKDFTYSVNMNFSYTPNKVITYKGKLSEGYDGDGNWSSNIGDVASSSSATNPIIEGHMSNEFYLKSPYKGTGKGYKADGLKGGPKDGMIRTETDMEWVQSMIADGYTFQPNKAVSQTGIWYGDYVYADVNGDGIYGSTYDREFQNVSANPKFNYGLQFNAAWKGIDFSMNWAGQAGYKLYWSPTVGYNTPAMRIGFALPTNIAINHYFYDPDNTSDTRTNINAKYGRLVASESGYQNHETSTLYLFNGNYLKLKNVTLGYTVPVSISRKIDIQNLRVYMSVENVFNITSFPGQDPELGSSPTYTSVRQFAFGVNVTF